MIVYKGYKAVYLGLKRWRVTTPQKWQFDALMRNGVQQLLDQIQYWEDIYEGDRA